MDKLPPLNNDLTEVLLSTEGAIYWLHITESDEVTVVPSYKEATVLAWESPWRTKEGEPVYGLVDEDGNEVGIARKTWA